MGVSFQRLHILLNCLNVALQLFNLFREVPKQIILQPVLHGVEFRHTVADRRTCSKDYTPVSGEFIHVAALAKHIAGFLRICSGKTGDIAHFCV